MKKELAKYFAQYKDIDTNRWDPVEELDEDVITETELDTIFKEIFAVDPVTGLPRGDLAYYLSSDGNPTVKSWLENNLLRPRASQGQSLEDVTDDLIEEMARRPDESFDMYSERLKSIFDDSVIKLNQYKQDIKSD